MNLSRAFHVDKLSVRVLSNDDEVGRAAADYVEDTLKGVLERKGYANIIIATGASQFTFYDQLKRKSNIDWSEITVFHLDEYAGMSDQHPASFRKYLKERILDSVKPKMTHFLNGDAEDLEAETKRYENLLKTMEIDLACIGIGENGHIAFNDPGVADFEDPRLVKIVELDETCRKQQLGEGWFPTLDEVPTHALTLTVPAIMRAKTISCVVPDTRKAEAVNNTLYGPVSEESPASILRTHENAVLWLDKNSASKVIL
jgi:glucosamine-6-phosphate deaminase